MAAQSMLIAAMLLMGVAPPSSDAATVYGPGSQPGPDKKPQACPRGTYKGYSGNYRCTKCKVGSVAPTTGRRSCIPCTPATLKTSNPAGTICVYKPGKQPKPSPTPKKTSLASKQAQIKRDASIYAPSAGCRAEIGGATRCGVPVGYKGSANRTGSVWLPKTYKNKVIPYMILLHGSGFTGDRMIDTFKNTANQWQYGVIAPDSRNDLYWISPATRNDPWTHDFYHIQAVWDRVMKMPGVKVNPKFIMIVGNSRAAFSAAAFASRSTIGINSCLLIHAAMEAKQMGYRTFPVYWATGSRDPLYGPKNATRLLAAFKRSRSDYKITYRVWAGSHTIRNYTELADWSKWWLVPSSRNDPPPKLRRALL